ncbi:MAG: ABC transporter substrate-binding protein [Ruminococcus sp.]|nr:ABC transporter substrate-binding protein [Ruminococcus sp.]
MRDIKKILAVILAMTFVAVPVSSCSKNKKTGKLDFEESQEEEDNKGSYDWLSREPTANKPHIDPPADITGTEIVWLSDYDLNPTADGQRSVALSLFEDVYGGKVKYVHTSVEDRFTTLSAMILAGDEVDMFEYDRSAFPDGAFRNQFEALDPYFPSLEIQNEIWDDMLGVIESFKYNGKHYVIPYDVTNSTVLTYSRTMIKNNNLKDPYELYKQGKWDWDSFMSIMESFHQKTNGIGINGLCGGAILHSSGHTIVNYRNGKFYNNIISQPIKEAEMFMQEISNKNLYSSYRNTSFPTGANTLFYASPEWTVGASNVKSTGMDFMVVPFPKCPDTEEYFNTYDYSAKMLVKNSTKGDAVATYIKCERAVIVQEDYKEPAKAYATAPKVNGFGVTTSQLTAEQYDALQDFKDLTKFTPVVDFAYGMGASMYTTEDSYGIVDRLERDMLVTGGTEKNWIDLRNTYLAMINDEVDRFNGVVKQPPTEEPTTSSDSQETSETSVAEQSTTEIEDTTSE